MKALFTYLVALGMGAFAAQGPATAQDQDLVKRGEYLTNGAVACGNCHNTRAEDMSFVPGKELAGGFHLQEPGIFDVYTANITPDPDTGIGTWTDEELIAAIREGKGKEGKIIFPPMPVPTYNNMSDDDVKAIVAYLRTVKPVHNEVPESKYSIPQQAMPPAKGLPAPTEKVAYGGYIANALAHCFECHTPAGPGGAPDMTKMGAGGFPIPLGPGMVVNTANITPDPETGIGKWTDEEIKKAMTEGVRPGGGKIAPPMPFMFFKNMTDEDLDAVVAYLRSIPPIKNQVARTEFQEKAFPRPASP
jgi:mono/diheme cytochrome c family protein